MDSVIDKQLICAISNVRSDQSAAAWFCWSNLNPLNIISICNSLFRLSTDDFYSEYHEKSYYSANITGRISIVQALIWFAIRRSRSNEQEWEKCHCNILECFILAKMGSNSVHSYISKRPKLPLALSSSRLVAPILRTNNLRQALLLHNLE